MPLYFIKLKSAVRGVVKSSWWRQAVSRFGRWGAGGKTSVKPTIPPREPLCTSVKNCIPLPTTYDRTPETVRDVKYQFPLLEWGWGKKRCEEYICEEYIIERLHSPFLKSACKFCPFMSRESAVQRYLNEPEEAASALLLESIALALNPRMTLFPYGSAHDLCIQSGNMKALSLYENLLKGMDWGLYRVERLWIRRTSQKTGKPFTRVDRRVAGVARGTKEQMNRLLLQYAVRDQGLLDQTVSGLRLYSERRNEEQLESCEGFWVVAAGVVRDKVRNERSFKENWDRVTGKVQQVALFDLPQSTGVNADQYRIL